MYFPPEDLPQQPTSLTGTVTPADPNAHEPARLAIRWDDGRRDYSVELEPSRFVKVPMLQVVPTWDERTGGWRVLGNRVETLADRDVSEGTGRLTPQPLSELPPGTLLDSVVASPDGTIVLYTELIPGRGGGGAQPPLRAQLRLLNSDGTPGPSLPSDGRHFDAMPSFTPDGGRIVFTSDRDAGGLDVWTIALGGEGAPVVEQLARGGEKAALWPMIDASPSQRLFYEAFLRTAPAPNQPRSEVRLVELESKSKRGLSPGTRPRASPRADAVVFTRADPDTGKRDLYMVSDKDGTSLGGRPVNLTRTPNVDECDPAFSRTGGKIAYASDVATADGRRQYDVYVLNVSDPSHPLRITQNASLDDSPAWDPAGKNVYFRSNRGGKWGVWRAPVP